MNKWVSMRDQWPENDQKDYYYFDVFENVYEGFFELTEDGWDCFYGKHGFLCGGDVEYWMPREEGDELPDTPEIKND